MKSVHHTTQINHVQISGLKKAETYQLKECEKLLKKEPMPEAITMERKDQSSSTIDCCGMIIAGINPHLISSIKLQLEVPLMPGPGKIFGLKEDASIEVKKDTSASVSLDLVRTMDGAIVLKKFHLAFNRSVTVKNPTASLKAHNENSSDTATAIKDSIAHVKIKDVVINQKGKVLVDGKIKFFGIFKKRLPRNASRVDLPKFNESFLESLGLAIDAPAQGIDEAEKIKKNINLKKVLTKLGAVAHTAAYSLKINGDRSKMSFLKEHNYFRGPKAPINIDLKGIIDLDNENDLLVTVDGKNSTISCSLGTFAPHIEASIHNLGSDKAVIVDLIGKVGGSARELHIDTFSQKTVKRMLPRRRGPDTRQKTAPLNENEFNASAGAKGVEVQAHMTIRADVKKSIENAHGSFSIKMASHDSYVKTQDRGITTDGRMSAYCEIDNFHYEKNDGLKHGSGSLGFAIHPSQKTLAKFPELCPLEYRYGLQISGKYGARLTPPEYGITRFLRPIQNFEGHIDRIDGSLTQGPLFPIGSKEYFKHVEKITGAKLRDASIVKLLIDGVNSMPERLRLINEAQDYICFQTLAFKDDASGLEYAHALVASAKRGVRVYGIVDSLGNIETLGGLERPHPIYEYLRQNGVSLQIYNGFFETGLRSIFRIVKKYPAVFKIENPQSLTSVAQILRFLDRVIEVAEEKIAPLSEEECLELKNGIHTIFDGKEQVSPEVSVNELRDMLKDNMTRLDELLSIIKRMGKASYRWHEKYLVVDHKKAIMGGMNIANEYLKGGTDEMVRINGKIQPAWRDTDVLLAGDIVAEAYQSFRRNWLHSTGERLDFGPKPAEQCEMRGDSCAVSMIQHRPLEDGDHKVTNYLLYNLRTLKAGEKAWFETAYFLPRGILRAFQKELVRAAKRGVDVRILTNSQSTSDFGPLVEASTFDVRELLEAGAKVYERNQGRMVHAKVMVLGNKLTMIGSWNCDNRSAAHDSEDVCTIYSADINRQMTDVLIKDMTEQSDQIHRKDMSKRSFLQEIRSAGMLLIGEMV